MSPLHVALAVLCMAVWGITFVAIRIGLDHFPPLMFAALRFAFASLPFLPFLRSPGAAWRWIVGVGLFLGVGQFGLLFVGMELGMPPGLTSAVIQTQVFFTILLATVFLKERPRWQSVGGTAVAFAGVLVIAGHLGSVPLLPFLLVIAGAFSWGIANVMMRASGSRDPLRLIVWASVVPPLPLLALSWAIEGGRPIADAVRDVSWAGAGAVAFVAFVATNLAFGLWSFLLQRYRSAIVAPFALLVPLFGMASSALLLGERFDTARLLGAGLIVAGVAASSWPQRRSQEIAEVK